MRGDSWRSETPRKRSNRMERWLQQYRQSPKMAILKCCSGCTTCCCRAVDQCASTDNVTSVSTASEDDTLIIVGNHQPNLFRELWTSTDMLFQSRLMWLLALGLLALVGDATGTLGEAACFCLSGIALIPCAERLSFVTEQVASRTNGTIGALLNATFGNAPELLISTAALRAGFYRVVQLAMLGSMLTNLLFVFGLSCLVGGIRWQVQELRIPSGGVSVGLLLMATAGSLLPAALEMSGQFPKQPKDEDIPTREELQFCRVNAVVMIFTYICYLMFQLGTHKEEFDDDQTDNSSDEKEDDNRDDTGGEMQQLFVSQTTRGNQGKRGMRAHPNVFCMRYFWCCKHNDLAKSSASTVESAVSNEDVEIAVGSPDIGLKPRADGDMPGYDEQQPTNRRHSNDGAAGDVSPSPYVNGQHQESIVSTLAGNEVLTTINEGSTATSAKTPHLRRKKNSFEESSPLHESLPLSKQNKMNRSDRNLVQRAAQPEDLEERTEKVYLVSTEQDVTMSLRAGIVWLFALTICISALSDILVDTIDGFAQRMHISEVFTSMVILPFFSNVAEQVSAVLFAYRNEMDLCVGVTVGSAIQIATFVLPGCVLIGAAVDRSMTLFFHGYETVCLLLGVLCVSSILQGGTTNWLVGVFLMGIYIMIATGIWFHESENLSTDAEIAIHNSTGFAT